MVHLNYHPCRGAQLNSIMEMEKCAPLSITFDDGNGSTDWVRFTAMSGEEAMYDGFAEGHI